MLGSGRLWAPFGETAMKICPVCKSEYPGGEVFCPNDGSRLTTPSEMAGSETLPDDPLVGIQLDKYLVKRLIGEGGMGLVYEGLHTFIEKQVAIKVLREDFTGKADVVERFQLEAKSASKIGHEHIVDIVDFGETPTGASYFVMEYLKGEDLAGLLSREGTLPPERAIHICLQCCRALGAAHSKGIVHRDMKPENIFLEEREDVDDFVKIVDFGIAKMSDLETKGEPGRKLTKTGMIFGTPEYMSPEQASGKELDHRVDIYAMGIILYELVTGKVPFIGDNFMGVLTQHMFEEAPPLHEALPSVNCPAELEAVIFKALSKSADERYQTMEELHEALEAASAGRMSEATLVGYGDPVKAKARGPRTVTPLTIGDDMGGAGAVQKKSKLPMVLGGLLVLAGLGGGAAYVMSQNQPGPDASTTSSTASATTAEAGGGTATTVGAAVVGAEGDDAGGAEDAPPAPEDAGAPEPEDAGPRLVRIRVETSPPGADVQLEGSPSRCSPSPCVLAAPYGEVARLTASRARLSGEAETTPIGDTTVQILLRAPRPAGMRGGTAMRPGMTPGGGMRGGGRSSSSDLKTPSLFR